MLRKKIIEKIKNEITKKDLLYFINYDVNPIKYYLDVYMKGLNKYIAITYLKNNWSLVEDIINNMEIFYEDIIKEKPDWKNVLSTNKGKLWFKKIMWDTYNELYDIVWGKNGK